MIVALLLCLPQAGAPTPDARLRELDLVRDFPRIVREYLPRVRPGGDLANDGRTLATVAHAALSNGALEVAGKLLARAQPTTGAEHIAIERAHLDLELDRLVEAASALLSEDERGTRMRYPDEPRAWMLFARSQARLQNYGAADKAAKGFLQLAPRDAEAASAWQIRADAALRRNDAQTAHACIAKAKELRRWHELLVVRRLQRMRTPDAELPQLGLALLWMEARDFERARAILADLTKRAPGFCRGWFHLGECRRLTGAGPAAESAYDRSLACAGEHAPTRANRAALRSAHGDWPGAQSDYAKLLSGPAAGDPRYLESYLEWARVLLRLGERVEADRRYAAYRTLGGKGKLE